MSHKFEIEYNDGSTETAEHIAGELPREGETVVHDGDEFEVQEVVHHADDGWTDEAMTNTNTVVHLSEV